MKKALLLLAPGFEEIEALGTCDVLRRLGIEVTLAGVSGIKVAGSHGIKVEADAELKDLDSNEYDALILPGGMPGAENLLAHKDLVREFCGEGRVVAAICAAPMVLSAAGVLHGRNFTMYPGFEKYLNEGEEPTGNAVEYDGNIVTAKGPGSTVFFAAAIGRLLDVPAERTGEVLDSMHIIVG